MKTFTSCGLNLTGHYKKLKTINQIFYWVHTRKQSDVILSCKNVFNVAIENENFALPSTTIMHTLNLFHCLYNIKIVAKNHRPSCLSRSRTSLIADQKINLTLMDHLQ